MVAFVNLNCFREVLYSLKKEIIKQIRDQHDN